MIVSRYLLTQINQGFALNTNIHSPGLVGNFYLITIPFIQRACFAHFWQDDCFDHHQIPAYELFIPYFVLVFPVNILDLLLYVVNYSEKLYLIVSIIRFCTNFCTVEIILIILM